MTVTAKQLENRWKFVESIWPEMRMYESGGYFKFARVDPVNGGHWSIDEVKTKSDANDFITAMLAGGQASDRFYAKVHAVLGLDPEAVKAAMSKVRPPDDD